MGALVYIYLRHNASFYFVRNMFAVAMWIANVGFMLFPTAPPRFFPEWGFTDSVANLTHVGHDSVTVNSLVNQYAAIPSMHVAFALMIAVPLARLSKHRVTRDDLDRVPLVVVFVIISTANHFLTDAFLGACTAGVRRLDRRRAGPRASGGLGVRAGEGDGLMADPQTTPRPPRRERSRAPIGGGAGAR